MDKKPQKTDVFTRYDVDRIRFRVLLHWIRSVLDKKAVPTRKYLWFPEERLSCYELRDGNPPHDDDRPRYLRGMKLHVDATNLPDWMREIMRPDGDLDQEIMRVCRENNLQDQDAHNVRIALFDRFAEKAAQSGQWNYT